MNIKSSVHFFISACIYCIFSLSFSAYSNDDIKTTADDSVTFSSTQDTKKGIEYLINMKNAVINRDYQIYFYTIENIITLSSSNTFRYIHVYDDKEQKEKASLISLDGLPREIILNNQIINYYEADVTPFALKGKYILESFPEVVYADFAKLTDQYNYILLGRARVANSSAQVIRISPKDNDRYSYLFWIDEQSYLPLRIDLLNQDSMTIKQFKVINFTFIDEKNDFVDYLETKNYPSIVPTEKRNSTEKSWQLTWLPKGFTESTSYNLFFDQTGIETELYKDGIFSFTISVSDKSASSQEIEIEDSTSIYSKNIGDRNIIVIGNLPISTLKKIVNHIHFN